MSKKGDGAEEAIFGLSVDIAEGRKAEGQPEFLAQLRAVLDVIPAYIWYAPPSGSLTFVNKRQADFLGLPNDHPLRCGIDIGAPWDAHIPFLHPDDQEKGRKYWSNSLRTGEGYEHSYQSVTLKETTAGCSLAPNRSGQAMEPCCCGLGRLWILKSSSAPRKDCGRANTSSVKSSKRYQHSSGRRTPPANRPNSISACWIIPACDLKTSSMAVGRPSCTLTTFQKLPEPSNTQFRPALRSRL